MVDRESNLSKINTALSKSFSNNYFTTIDLFKEIEDYINKKVAPVFSVANSQATSIFMPTKALALAFWSLSESMLLNLQVIILQYIFKLEQLLETIYHNKQQSQNIFWFLYITSRIRSCSFI